MRPSIRRKPSCASRPRRRHSGKSALSAPFEIANGLAFQSENIVSGDRLRRVQDADADGWPDTLAILGSRVVLGYGPGGFQQTAPPSAEIVVDVGAPIRDAALGDFDHDGRLDVAVATDSDVRLLRATGARNLGDAELLSAEAAIDQIVFVDFNHDGLDDLVALTSDGLVNVLRQEPVPGQLLTTASAWPGGGPAEATVGDIDRDGDLDLGIGRASGEVVLVAQHGGLLSQPRTLTGVQGRPSRLPIWTSTVIRRSS
jgi:hypothetical protein